MKASILRRMRCATCASHPLSWESFSNCIDGVIREGVVWCRHCASWFPIEDTLLELLPRELAYEEDRIHFWKGHQSRLEALGLRKGPAQVDVSAVREQQKQKEHFDWYAANEEQTYDDFEKMGFWELVTSFDIARWRREIVPGTTLLEVGCAQGRTTFPFMDLPIDIVAFDISKLSIKQAIDRYRKGNYRARATFFVGDATRIPFLPESFFYVLLYGVLHHLPDPGQVCRQVAEVLQPGGTYFGTENNATKLRPIFELLQKVLPLWHEEAGAHPLISHANLQSWLHDTDVVVDTRTHVFVPPHVVNVLGKRIGGALLRWTDRIGQALPGVRQNGGLIVIKAQRAA